MPGVRERTSTKAIPILVLTALSALAIAQELAVGDAARFGDGVLAEVLGMTYAQPVACSPALTVSPDDRYESLQCAVHPISEEMLRAELELVLAARHFDDSENWDISGDELLLDGREYLYETWDGGFLHVFQRRE